MGTRRKRDEGAGGFFRAVMPWRGHKLTPKRLEQVQGMLDAAMEVPAIERELGVLANTIHKEM